MAAPTRVTGVSVVLNTTTTPKTTSSLTLSTGDVLVVIAGAAGPSSGMAANPTNSAGSITWTLQQSVAVAGFGDLKLWTGAVTAGATSTISVACTGGLSWGFIVEQYASGAVVGTSVVNHASTGNPTIAITTGVANAAIVSGSTDFNGTTGTITWSTVNGSAETAQATVQTASDYGAYYGFVPDAGAAGSKTVGVTAPTGQVFAVAAVEIQGGAAAAANQAVASTNRHPGKAPGQAHLAIRQTLDYMVVGSQTAAPPATVNVAALAPAVTGDASVTAVTGTVNVASPTPAITAAASVTAVVGTVNVAAPVPAATGDASVTAVTATVNVASPAPVVYGEPIGRPPQTNRHPGRGPGLAHLTIRQTLDYSTPAVPPDGNVTAVTATVNVAAPAPAVTAGAGVSAPVGAVNVAALAPAVTAGAGVPAPVSTVNVASPTPAVTGDANITAVTATVNVAAQVPVVYGEPIGRPQPKRFHPGNGPGGFGSPRTASKLLYYGPQDGFVFPGVSTISVVSPAPAVTGDASVSAPVGTVNVAAPVPAVSGGAGGDGNVTAVTATVNVAALAPAVTGGSSVTAPVGTVAVAALAPAVTGGSSVTAPVGTVAVSAKVPVVTGGSSVTAPVGTVTVSAKVPVVTGGSSVTAAPAVITIAALAPVVSSGTGGAATATIWTATLAPSPWSVSIQTSPWLGDIGASPWSESILSQWAGDIEPSPWEEDLE